MRIKKEVTHESSDEEIFAAIREAGEHRHSWRSHDWPNPEENYQFSWVKPGDIGLSTRSDQKLCRRLKKMVLEGSLESYYKGYSNQHHHVFKNGYSRIWKTSAPNLPRFRVIEKN